MAGLVKDIEDAIQQLPQEQLREFRAWYESSIRTPGISKLRKTS